MHQRFCRRECMTPGSRVLPSAVAKTASAPACFTLYSSLQLEWESKLTSLFSAALSNHPSPASENLYVNIFVDRLLHWRLSGGSLSVSRRFFRQLSFTISSRPWPHPGKQRRSHGQTDRR